MADALSFYTDSPTSPQTCLLHSLILEQRCKPKKWDTAYMWIEPSKLPFYICIYRIPLMCRFREECTHEKNSCYCCWCNIIRCLLYNAQSVCNYYSTSMKDGPNIFLQEVEAAVFIHCRTRQGLWCMQDSAPA